MFILLCCSPREAAEIEPAAYLHLFRFILTDRSIQVYRYRHQELSLSIDMDMGNKWI